VPIELRYAAVALVGARAAWPGLVPGVVGVPITRWTMQGMGVGVFYLTTLAAMNSTA